MDQNENPYTSNSNDQGCPFNDDILYNILTRVSMETLGRCRVVSKKWKSMTYEPFFQQLQAFSQKGHIVSGYITHKYWVDYVPNNTKFVPSFSFIPGYNNLSVEAVSNLGFLLCCEFNLLEQQYYVCKPSTRQFCQIPKLRSSPSHVTYQIVLRLNPLHYKILRILRLDNPKSGQWRPYLCQVFNSKTWAWKRLKDLLIPRDTFLVVHYISSGMVFACGALHILSTDDQVLAFDVENESWTRFRLPKPNPISDTKKLVECRGRLGVFIYNEGENTRCNIEIWVVRDYVKHKVWNKMNSIEITENVYGFPTAFCSSNVILLENANSMWFYDFVRHKAELSKAHKLEFWNFGHHVQFMTDFEPCHSLQLQPRLRK